QIFIFSSRRRHTRSKRDWSSDVCSSDLVVSGAGSDITGPADLAGKKVAVNSLGAAGDLTIMAAVEQDGGDPSTIEFVEVAFPDRSEERRVGKEWQTRGGGEAWKRTGTGE